MPIDPNILLRANGIKTQGPVQSMAQLMQLQGMRQRIQEGQIRQQKFAQEQRQAQTKEAREAQLMQRQESFWREFGSQEQPSITPQTISKARFAGIDLDVLKQATEAENWGRIKADMQDFGGYKQPVDEYGNIVGDRVNKTMTQAERDSAEMSRKRFNESRRHNQETEGLTRRGQTLTNARAKEKNEFDRLNPSLATVTTEDGVFQVPNRGGQGRQVMGPDGRPLSGKPLTEGQANAAIYGERAMEAEQVIESLEGQISGAERLGMAVKDGASTLPIVGGVAQMVGNALSTSEMRQMSQAKRNFINATLRRESGAVISDSEFENANLQYFPQPNDDAKTLALKKQNRETVIRGLRRAAGSAGSKLQASPIPDENAVTGTIGGQDEFAGFKVLD